MRKVMRKALSPLTRAFDDDELGEKPRAAPQTAVQDDDD